MHGLKVVFSLVVVGALALSSCAEKPAAEKSAEQRCVGTFPGTWSGQVGSASATVVATTTCDFVFSSDWTRCTSRGLFSPVVNGKFDVSISQNTGGFPCPAVGGHSCVIGWHSADDVDLNCGASGRFSLKRL